MAIPIHYEFLSYKFDRAQSTPITLEEFNELRTTRIQDIYRIVNARTREYQPFRDIAKHYFSSRRLIVLSTCIGFVGLSTWLTWYSKSGIVDVLTGLIALAVVIYAIQFVRGAFKTWDMVSELQDQMMQYYKKHKEIVDGVRSYDEYKQSISKVVW